MKRIKLDVWDKTPDKAEMYDNKLEALLKETSNVILIHPLTDEELIITPIDIKNWYHSTYCTVRDKKDGTGSFTKYWFDWKKKDTFFFTLVSNKKTKDIPKTTDEVILQKIGKLELEKFNLLNTLVK